LSEERLRLRRLLEHWINHTHEHEETFREWSEKTKSDDLYPVSPQLSEAANIMAKVVAKLKETLDILE